LPCLAELDFGRRLSQHHGHPFAGGSSGTPSSPMCPSVESFPLGFAGYAEKIWHRFPEVFIALGSPDLDEHFDLGGVETLHSVVNSALTKEIHIVLARQATQIAFSRPALDAPDGLESEEALMLGEHWPLKSRRRACAAATVGDQEEDGDTSSLNMMRVPSSTCAGSSPTSATDGGIHGLSPQSSSVVTPLSWHLPPRWDAEEAPQPEASGEDDPAPAAAVEAIRLGSPTSSSATWLLMTRAAEPGDASTQCRHSALAHRRHFRLPHAVATDFRRIQASHAPPPPPLRPGNVMSGGGGGGGVSHVRQVVAVTSSSMAGSDDSPGTRIQKWAEQHGP